MKQLHLLIACLLSSLPLLAVDHPLTMSELVNIALENNPKTKKAWWEAKKAQSAVGSAKSAYYPQVDLKLNAEHGKEFKFINGPDTKYTELGANLALSLLLFDFGERSGEVSAAKEALAAASWQSNWAIQEVLVVVLESAYETFHAHDKLQATLRSLADAKMLAEIAEARNKAGVSPISDVYTSLAKLCEMQMEVVRLQSDLDIKKGKLALKLWGNSDTPFELASLEALSIPEKETNELISYALEKRADLLAKQALCKEAELLVEKAQSAHMPKLSLNSTAGYNHYTHDHTKSGTYQVGVTLDMPLFSGFDTLYKTRVAMADSKMRQAELSELERQIAQEVLEYNLSIASAKTRYNFAENLLKNSEMAYSAVIDTYKAGKEKMFSEVSNAQAELARTRTLLSQVKLELLVFVAKLAYATGTLPTPTEPRCN